MSADTDKQALGEFFDFIWEDTEGLVYLPVFTRDEDRWRKVMYKWPEKRDAVIEHVIVNRAKPGTDVYYSPAIYKDARPIKENVLGSHVLWVDFDGTAPGEWTDQTGQVASGAHTDAGGVTTDHVPAPSLRLQTSKESHQHVYWKLDKFVTDIKAFEARNQSLTYTLGADTGGWDATQILRPPYTTNQKHNVQVIIAEETDSRFQFSRFDFLPTPKALVSSKLDTESTIPLEQILARYTWDEEHYTLVTAEELPDGLRSTKMMQLGYYGAEQGMSDEEIYSILIHVDDKWGKFKKRTDRVRRLTDLINRARQKHPLQERPSSDLVVEQDTKYIYGFQEFLDTDFHVDWLVDGMLARNGLGLIASMGGIGKTQISLQLGIHMALSKEFLGKRPNERARVGFLSLEMGREAIKLFMSNMGQVLNDDDRRTLQHNFFVVPLGEPIPIERPDGRKFLEDFIADYDLDIVIVDSMGKLLNGDLSSDTDVRAFFNYLGSVRAKHNCAFWIIHHNRKKSENNKKPKELSDVYGSQYITSEPDYVCCLWKEDVDNPDGTIEFRELKNRLGIQERPFFIQRIEHLNFVKTDQEGTERIEGKEVTDASDQSNRVIKF